MRRFFQSFLQRTKVSFLFSSRFSVFNEFLFYVNSLISNKIHFIRYLKCNLFYEVPKIQNMINVEIEILFVTAGKDSEILPHAISGAIRSTHNYRVRSITIICPKADLLIVKQNIQSIDYPFLVIPEDEIIEDNFVDQLRDLFGSRFGWVLQQLLKINFVKKSGAAGVLIIDSDTILSKPRLWLDSDRTQVLMPTWERHTPYFDFLRINNFCVQQDSFSHISHHMLVQPDILREMLSRYKLNDLDTFIQIFSACPPDVHSPFSIDYEMYAQYLITHYPHLVRYEKWANYSVRLLLRSEIGHQLNSRKIFYNSISAHSYNQY
jgi:hypothetical protein